MSLAQQFILPEINTRSDEYGGNIENRVRLTKELLEETKEAVGDTCAVAFRFAVDELKGPDGMQSHEEGRAVVELLAELPDLWDVNVSDWSNDSQTTRFEMQEGYQTRFTEFVKRLTSNPNYRFRSQSFHKLSKPCLIAFLHFKARCLGVVRPV
jgi:dimethylamine/trimethylamine dehydrogenase